METTIQSLNPAIQRYLTALWANLQATTSDSRDAALADAQEYLLSEWESVRRRQPECTADELYEHFAEKFGSPTEVAACYMDVAGVSDLGKGAAACEQDSNSSRSRSRGWLWAAVIAQMALLVAGGAWLFNLRAGAATESSATTGVTLVTVAPEDSVASAWRVVSAQQGSSQRRHSLNPEAALGPPDCQDSGKQLDAFYCLGHGGELVVEFEKCRLVDGPGADLAIFEVGFPAEPVDVAVSEDGENWFAVGRTGRDATTLDLAGHDLTGRKFRYVRIVDAKTKISGKPEFWGADIDAIVALHTVRAP